MVMAFARSSPLFVLLLLVLETNSLVNPEKSTQKRSDGGKVAEEKEAASDSNGKKSHGYRRCLSHGGRP